MTKKKNYVIWLTMLGILSVLVVLSSNAVSFGSDYEEPDSYPMTTFILESAQLHNGQWDRSEATIWLDEQENFRVEYTSGAMKGGYEIWDGQKFYRYSPDLNMLDIFVEEGFSGRVSPAMLLSIQKLKRVNDDIKNNRLEYVGQIENDIKEAEVFRHAHPFHYEEGEREYVADYYKMDIDQINAEVHITEEITIAADRSMVLGVKSYLGDQLIKSEAIVDVSTIDAFDSSLLELHKDIADFQHVTESN